MPRPQFPCEMPLVSAARDSTLCPAPYGGGSHTVNHVILSGHLAHLELSLAVVSGQGQCYEYRRLPWT
ncbi:hypothetical protein JI435_409060, partial [Parastagonospora nodorum SN15]